MLQEKETPMFFVLALEWRANDHDSKVALRLKWRLRCWMLLMWKDFVNLAFVSMYFICFIQMDVILIYE